jgi:hypothetical protein
MPLEADATENPAVYKCVLTLLQQRRPETFTNLAGIVGALGPRLV